jgi:hypothetical protein
MHINHGLEHLCLHRQHLRVGGGGGDGLASLLLFSPLFSVLVA